MVVAVVAVVMVVVVVVVVVMAVVLRWGKFLGIAVPREPARKARIPHIWVAHFPDGEGRPVFTLPPSIPCTRPPVHPWRPSNLHSPLTASFSPPY